MTGAYTIYEERGVYLVGRFLTLVRGIFGDKVLFFMRKYPPPPTNKGAYSDKDPEPSF